MRYRKPDASLASFAVPDRQDIVLSNTSSIIVRQLFWFGMDGYEGAEARIWERFCAKSRNILEIGANIGFYTVCACRASPAAQVTAVEPHPVAASVLRKNLMLNGLDRVRVIESAVVGHKQAETMNLLIPTADQDEAPTGSFLQSGGELLSPTRAAYSVPVVAIQSLIEGVDLLKLDVEGYEAEILQPIRGYLTERRPTLFVEFLPEASRLSALLQELCREAGYRPFVCTRTTERAIEPAELSGETIQRRYGARDIFLVRPEATGLEQREKP